MRPSERRIRNQQALRCSLRLSAEWTKHRKVSTLEERRKHHSVGRKASSRRRRFAHANVGTRSCLLDNDSGTCNDSSFVEKLKADESKPPRESGYGLLFTLRFSDFSRRNRSVASRDLGRLSHSLTIS